MADPGAVTTAAKVSLKDQIARRFAADRSEWDALVCDNKDQIGRSIDEIDRWVRRIAECVAIKNGSTTIANSDQIGPDQFSHGVRTISGSFGILQGGQLMNALGNNNDCLIHSFLTCVSPTFRTVVEEARIKIAGYFRRFILPTIQHLHNVEPANVAIIRERLQSYHFLTGGEINILSSYYQVPIINIQDGNNPLERSMEIFPTQTDIAFWNNSKSGAYDGPFYMIHGDDTHFTPVMYGGSYQIRQRRVDLMKIASDITKAHDDVFGKASEEGAKLDVVKQDFKHRIQAIVDSFKKEIVQSNNSENKSIELSSILEILTPVTKEYIDDIIQQGLIDEGLKDKAYMTIYTVLLHELSKKKNTSSTTSNAPSANISELEEFAGQAGLTDEDALVKAIKASQNESNGINSTITVPGMQSRSNSSTQVVLRTLRGIKATVGENSGKYTATVYEPVTSKRSNGGKRNTKKVMRVKKQKTKKLKKRSV
jgi:hypothetical protein